MALIIVNLTDTFDDWRVKTNSFGTSLGDLTTLSTTAKGNLVAAINESLQDIVEDTAPQLGGNLDLNNFTINGPGTIASTVTLIGVPTTGFTIAMAVALG